MGGAVGVGAGLGGGVGAAVYCPSQGPGVRAASRDGQSRGALPLIPPPKRC
jgi:hypothetical protein